MYLLSTTTHRLQDFVSGSTSVPLYAILSHAWADEEVTFKDMDDLDGTAKKRKGWSKIDACCRRARDDGFDWVWVDTCCIDKSSSAELSEAINSMWAYYLGSEVCYAFLADVEVPTGLKGGGGGGKLFTDGDFKFGAGWDVLRASLSVSRWFTRGWTLQELLAPKKVLFLGRDWESIGWRDDLVEVIESITGIDKSHVGGGGPYTSVSVARRMSWASKRNTTRPEDMAYCLLGLFQINMPLLYGEGIRAFKRLQLEIIHNTTDQSIFAWKCDASVSAHQAGEAQGMLAESPAWFKDSGLVRDNTSDTQPFSPSTITNAGILIRLQIEPLPPLSSPSIHHYGIDSDLRLMRLACSAPDENDAQGQVGICIRIKGRSFERDIPKKGQAQGDFIRAAVRAFPDYVHVDWRQSIWPYKAIYLRY